MNKILNPYVTCFGFTFPPKTKKANFENQPSFVSHKCINIMKALYFVPIAGQALGGLAVYLYSAEYASNKKMGANTKKDLYFIIFAVSRLALSTFPPFLLAIDIVSTLAYFTVRNTTCYRKIELL